MSERTRQERLLGRAGFGPRPGDRERIAELGASAWIERELRPAADPALERRLAGFEARDQQPGALTQGMALPKPGDRDLRADRARAEIRSRRREIAIGMAGVRMVRVVHGERAVREVLIDFFANHFNVYAFKGLVGGPLPHYQREVLEPHALGHFEELLIAVAASPAMLVYLDNWLSSAPGTRLRQGRRGKGGLNENYARELLELHTLGVDAGYTQQDVIEVARVFTGWTIESRKEPSFRFRERLHDPGRKVVLGRSVRGEGQEQGLGLLRRLARHPATARHLSFKLCQRFVADAPPAPLVERCARRFQETRGEIREVVRTILISPEFVDPAHRKLKTPLRLTASALRATGGETDGGRPLFGAQGRVGEVPFLARAPTGYPEEARQWLDPGAVLERMSLAFALAGGRVRGTRLGDAAPGDDVLPAGGKRREALAVAIAAPEFQWT